MVEPSKPVKSNGLFSRKQGNILGVDITGTSRKRLLIKISEYFQKNRHFKANLASVRPLFITTPNPEQAVMSHEDPRFREILHKSDISLCDGVGLLVAYEYYLKLKSLKRTDKPSLSDLHENSTFQLNNSKRYSSFKKPVLFFRTVFSVLKTRKSSDGVKVIKGRDFMMCLLSLANEKRYKVFLLGSTKRVLERTIIRLSKQFPAVHFKTYHGARLDTNSVPLTDKEIKKDKKSIRMINRFRPQMLFVAYSAPKQEKWVYRNIDQLKTGLVMVVGGSFDYIAGTRKTVPLILNNIGLEWLWRLLTGSQNLKRVYNAVVKFPVLVLKES